MLWLEHNMLMSIPKSLEVMETGERHHVPVGVWSGSDFEAAPLALQLLKHSSLMAMQSSDDGSGKIATTVNYKTVVISPTSTYDHRSVKTGHPVRSAIHKH
jgi:hypothetical protein